MFGCKGVHARLGPGPVKDKKRARHIQDRPNLDIFQSHILSLFLPQSCYPALVGILFYLDPFWL